MSSSPEQRPSADSRASLTVRAGAHYRRLSARTIRLTISVVLAAAPALAIAEREPHSHTLQYEAILFGLTVGRAEVTVRRDAGSYQIDGSAAARSVGRVFSDWRSVFYARGHLTNTGPVLSAYGYDEQDGRKHRVLQIADGRVQQLKNGQPRPDRPVLPGLDVLTAAFIQPTCEAKRLHTGRTNYWVTVAQRGNPRICELEVRDDDGDRRRVRLTLAEQGGMTVPARLEIRGLLPATIRLLPARSPAGADAP